MASDAPGSLPLSRDVNAAFIKASTLRPLVTGRTAGEGLHLRILSHVTIWHFPVNGLEEPGFRHPDRGSRGVKAVSVTLLDPGVIKVVLAQKELQGLHGVLVQQLGVLPKVVIELLQQTIPRLLRKKDRRVGHMTRATLRSVQLTWSICSQSASGTSHAEAQNRINDFDEKFLH